MRGPGRAWPLRAGRDRSGPDRSPPRARRRDRDVLLRVLAAPPAPPRMTRLLVAAPLSRWRDNLLPAAPPQRACPAFVAVGPRRARVRSAPTPRLFPGGEAATIRAWKGAPAAMSPRCPRRVRQRRGLPCTDVRRFRDPAAPLRGQARAPTPGEVRVHPSLRPRALPVRVPPRVGRRRWRGLSTPSGRRLRARGRVPPPGRARIGRVARPVRGAHGAAPPRPPRRD